MAESGCKKALSESGLLRDGEKNQGFPSGR
jgi:hypothetical protein